MKEWIKAKWKWITGGVIIVLGVLSTKKTKNNVKEEDAEAAKRAAEKIAKDQEKLTKDYVTKKEEIRNKKDNVEKDVKKKLEEEAERMKKDNSLIDAYLNSKGLKKK